MKLMKEGIIAIILTTITLVALKILPINKPIEKSDQVFPLLHNGFMGIFGFNSF
ncbi:MAG: hypothetical protein U5K55_10295 [Aliarcobacter sp.]|nr:hypothetical protein [Aliarcobacter sp.]